MQFKLPPVLATDERQNGNTIQQLIEPGCTLKATIASYTGLQIKGKMLVAEDGGDQILLLEKPAFLPHHFGKVIHAKRGVLDGTSIDLSQQKWLKHPKLLNS